MASDPIAPLPDDKDLLTMKDIFARAKLHPATVYRLIAADLFPKGRLIGPNTRRWSRREIREWLVGDPPQDPQSR